MGAATAKGKRTKVVDLTEKLSVRKPSTTVNFIFKMMAHQRQFTKLNPTMRLAAKNQTQTNSGDRMKVKCSKHPELKHK